MNNNNDKRNSNMKNLSFFFILSYVLMIVIVLIQIGVRILINNYFIDMFFAIFAITTPTIAAVIIAGYNDGIKGIRV